MNPTQAPNNSNFHPSTSAPLHDSNAMTKHSFFYNPPNDPQIYNIHCIEIAGFELALQLVNNNINSTQNHVPSNNLLEFHFFKLDERKCYEITCELVSHSLITQYLNENIHGIEIRQQQEYVEFSRQLKENLEYHLRQFLTYYL